MTVGELLPSNMRTQLTGFFAVFVTSAAKDNVDCLKVMAHD